ncbi:MAG: hypothetical protein U0840_27000 [Gemmataceae bacterium]
MLRFASCLTIIALLALTAGCGTGSNPTDGPKNARGDAPAKVEDKKYLLSAEPAGVKGVLETRKQAKDGDDVVMVGHIAGSTKPFVDGRASFAVLDLSIKPCPPEEGCPTPWDCCCTPPDELRAATAQVKFTGEDGKTVGVSAKELLGVKELSVVVVKGKANRDEKGNLTLVASGLFVRADKN